LLKLIEFRTYAETFPEGSEQVVGACKAGRLCNFNNGHVRMPGWLRAFADQKIKFEKQLMSQYSMDFDREYKATRWPRRHW